MAMQQLTAFQIRMLKGAAISIWALFQSEQRSLNQNYMRRYSGYSNESVHDALETLRDADLIVQTGRYEWSLTNGARQLPFGAESLPEPTEEEPDNSRIAIQVIEAFPEEPGQEEPELDNSSPVSSDNSGAEPLASSRSLIKESRENLLLARAASSGKSGAKSLIADNLAELARHHIREPAKTRLARLEHVTPEMICAHCEGKPPGQAIYRIEHNWPVESEDDENDRKKYISGEFAKFIEH
jgi:hypothetical protein